MNQKNVPNEQPSEEDEDRLDKLPEIVASDLALGGRLSTILTGYEPRPAQVEMAVMVARAIAENASALIEAPTGTGKTLSYLLALARSGKRAIISTSNKSLQEQLLYKDIPLVQEAIGQCNVAMVKGTGNYLCLFRVEQERIGTNRLHHPDLDRVLHVVDASDEHFTGDLDLLDFQIDPTVRERVRAESDDCTWKECSQFPFCYVRRMKDRAAQAQITVVNHTLLLLDAALGGSLLPKRDVIVIDEAHNLEEEAIQAFTLTITHGQVATFLSQRRLQDHGDAELIEAVQQANDAVWQSIGQIKIAEESGKHILSTPIVEGVQLSERITRLASSLKEEKPAQMSGKEAQLYNKLVARAQQLALRIGFVFSVDTTKPFVYYLEQTEGKKGKIQRHIKASPLTVAPFLKENVFDRCLTICTSATIATSEAPAFQAFHPLLKASGPTPTPSFSYFRRITGWGPRTVNGASIEHILPLTFSYQDNALLYLPTHLPEPRHEGEKGEDAYLQALAQEMSRLVKISRGRAFLLFSSRRAMERVYDLMQQEVAMKQFNFIRQGDTTRKEMIHTFRETPSVLFGLKSFWEGIDIAGDALSLVIVDKLPFQHPDNPVHEARARMMEANGENWFGLYVLPQVILRLKQGLGRLLRTSSDSGVMAILDTRMHTRQYARTILSSLPPARTTTRFAEVEHFFRSPRIK
jgi:Rad3-related DNA helicase